MNEIVNWVDRLPEAPTDMILRLRRDLAKVVADCDFTVARRMARQGPAEAPPAQRPDDLIRIREACARMGWRYSWAQKHWGELGGFRDSDGALKIRASVLAKHGS
jgi:hypothetical protein